MSSSPKLRTPTLLFLAASLVGSAGGMATCRALAAKAEPKARDAKPEIGSPAAEKKETVTAALKMDKNPAVFAPGEPIALHIALKYTGEKPKVGFVEVIRFWTFLFTPAGGGIPRKAMLTMNRTSKPRVPGGGPNPPLAPLPLENGKEASRTFVLNQTGDGQNAWWYEFADARQVPKEQKKQPLAQLPPGKYTLTATHKVSFRGNPDNWYDPVTTNAVQIEITAKP